MALVNPDTPAPMMATRSFIRSVYVSSTNLAPRERQGWRRSKSIFQIRTREVHTRPASGGGRSPAARRAKYNWPAAVGNLVACFRIVAARAMPAWRGRLSTRSTVVRRPLQWLTSRLRSQQFGRGRRFRSAMVSALAPIPESLRALDRRPPTAAPRKWRLDFEERGILKSVANAALAEWAPRPFPIRLRVGQTRNAAAASR